MYLPWYYFVVFGCSDIVWGGFSAYREEVETCVGLLQWTKGCKGGWNLVGQIVSFLCSIYNSISTSIWGFVWFLHLCLGVLTKTILLRRLDIRVVLWSQVSMCIPFLCRVWGAWWVWYVGIWKYFWVPKQGGDALYVLHVYWRSGMWWGFVSAKFGKFIDIVITRNSQVCTDFLEGEGMCCNSHRIMVCMSSLSWWLCGH